jgi:hypothetical protein
MSESDDLTTRLVALATRPDGAAERDALEQTFAVIVRLALRRGRGHPHVVRWVERTHGHMAGPRTTAPPIHFAPQIARLLLDRVLNRIRPAAATRPRHWTESVHDG